MPILASFESTTNVEVDIARPQQFSRHWTQNRQYHIMWRIMVFGNLE